MVDAAEGTPEERACEEMEDRIIAALRKHGIKANPTTVGCLLMIVAHAYLDPEQDGGKSRNEYIEASVAAYDAIRKAHQTSKEKQGG